MKKKSFEVPALYGDHHVIEVRRLLLEIPGVKEVYASSAFHTVEVAYDEKATTDLAIQAKMDDAGYIGDWSVARESGKAVGSEDGQEAFFRHTAVYETTRQVVSFAQKAPSQGKPLWPCPGIGVLKREEE